MFLFCKTIFLAIGSLFAKNLLTFPECYDFKGDFELSGDPVHNVSIRLFVTPWDGYGTIIGNLVLCIHKLFIYQQLFLSWLLGISGVHLIPLLPKAWLNRTNQTRPLIAANRSNQPKQYHQIYLYICKPSKYFVNKVKVATDPGIDWVLWLKHNFTTICIKSKSWNRLWIAAQKTES